MLGTVVEASDIVLYAYLAVYTAPLWFPTSDPAVSLLATLGVYAVGYAARPVGGILFGRMGDRRGRRQTLIVTLTLMGCATFALGLIPTYATIGILAPVLVLLARILQGIAAGGEVIGAATYALESSPPGRRGLFSAFTPLGAGLGLVVAPVAIGLSNLAVGPAAMAAWGWRIPFFVALVLTFGVLAFRLRIEDSAEFQALQKTDAISETPLRDSWRDHKTTILLTILMGAGTLYVAYAVNVYLPVYFTTVTKLSPAAVPWMVALVMLLAAPAVLAGGLLADRFGRQRVVVAVLAVLGVAGYPLFILFSDGSLGLVAIGAVYFCVVVVMNLGLAAAYQSFSDVFPARVRFTAAAIGYNVGNMIGAGFGPLLSAELIRATGSARAPGWLFTAGAVIGICGLLAVTRLHRTPRSADPV
jgi:MHS family proline/betaine transporter-like MFS transporter